MDFWNKRINVSREAAQKQVSIIKSFSSEKRMKIALDFANLGISRTRDWIKSRHPDYSELEVTLEFVRLVYHSTGRMSEKEWLFYKEKMEQRIKNDWAERFRKMMKENNWGYDDIARMGNFKNGEVVKSTVSRGLPSFAKLAVRIYEKINKETARKS